jgi:hypothetical protein
VPVGEFFWTGFLKRCKEKWGADFDPYRYFDLDYIVIGPNMDPRIQPFEVICETGDDITIKTCYGAAPLDNMQALELIRHNIFI